MAGLIDFTTAEGYFGTGQFGVWGDSLQAQGGGGAIWKENTWGSFAVDAGNDLVVMDGASTYRKGIYQTPYNNTITSYTTSISFQFDRDTTAPTNSGFVVALGFGDTTDGSGSTRVDIQLERMNGGNSGFYRLKFWENSGASSISNTFGWSNETLLGFSDASDTTSDMLSLSITLERGADENDWTLSAGLVNLDNASGVNVSSGSLAMETSLDFFNSDLYAVINSADLESKTLTSNRIIDTFSVTTAGGAVPEPGTYAMVVGALAMAFVFRRRMKR